MPLDPIRICRNSVGAIKNICFINIREIFPPFWKYFTRILWASDEIPISCLKTSYKKNTQQKHVILICTIYILWRRFFPPVADLFMESFQRNSFSISIYARISPYYIWVHNLFSSYINVYIGRGKCLLYTYRPWFCDYFPPYEWKAKHT